MAGADGQARELYWTVDTPRLKVKRLDPGATIPAYQSAGAAGLDLSACLPGGPVVIEPGRIAAIPCGIAVAIAEGFEGQVRPRSGLATRHGISMPNTPGTIDSDYRGPVIVPLINHGKEPFSVTHGMRIAQMVIAPVARATVVEVDSLDATERGAGGFGSTGTH
ncbi:MAG: Deoxyuridine 5'-triphosphate nucleotidohydrolase [Phycisphaerales bacterium]|nr:Deoxyuridine 5'-triphosphate nucleotidohydrolase [Phycisphaerales bacterium]